MTLLTSDMAKAVEFYEGLGFQLLYGGKDASFSSFAAGAAYLNLQLDPDRQTRPEIWGRVVIYVDDVDAMCQRAIGSGFRPETAPADASWGERHFHIRDRDGHELSFARPLAGR